MFANHHIFKLICLGFTDVFNEGWEKLVLANDLQNQSSIRQLEKSKTKQEENKN